MLVGTMCHHPWLKQYVDHILLQYVIENAFFVDFQKNELKKIKRMEPKVVCRSCEII